MTSADTTIEVVLQDPGADAGYLLESLLETCQKADRGGAIFAWTNAAGATAFLGDPAFEGFAQSGKFELVVGVDSITDERAVAALIGFDDKFPKVHIRAFMHDDAPLFHPKLAWFVSRKRLTLVVGSGNLTVGGLKGNWEAYSVCKIGAPKAAQVEQSIVDWLDAWDESLLDISDPRVLDRAKKNTGNEQVLKRATGVKRKPSVLDESLGVLVAEIPRGGSYESRWSQANFDLENYEGFFGAKRGTQRRILLYHVSDTGMLGGVESRPSIAVKSQNYRFELAAAHNVTYPTDGRPIGVFLRLKTGQFLYMLLLPKSSHYAEVSGFLDQHWSGRPDRMRRVRASVTDLRAAWPSSPLWTVQLPQL
jgi:hypothetical protein